MKHWMLTLILVSAIDGWVWADEAPRPGTSPLEATAGNPDEELAGGATTVIDSSQDAFGFPAANLPMERRASFFVGNSFFRQNWVAAASSTSGRDGLGPLFNTRSCAACHFKDGRGHPPEPGKAFVSMLLRISLPGTDAQGALIPDPVYGDQIQGDSLPEVKPEADVLVDYETVEGSFADGDTYSLRRPAYRLANLNYGPVAPDLQKSPRVAPAIIGLGLLESISEARLNELEDPDDRNQDGISGRLNRVWDEHAKTMRPGRFGWKAEQPSVAQQVASAFRGDMGLTTSLFPTENHTPGEKGCDRLPSGGSPEVSDKIFSDVVFYSRTLAVPAQRNAQDPKVRRGKSLFSSLRCAACHTPAHMSSEQAVMPELANQTIHPYTDLLLHDLGEELSDHRPVFGASGNEWRTPPLWGLGLVPIVNGHTTLLHDGRARNFTEAILWHAGEADASRVQFKALDRVDRNALIAFLQSL